MKPSTVLFLAVAAVPTYAVTADPFEQWQGPTASDVRGPCPFLNTFANHGFLPRSGKYITEQILIDGLFDAVNFNETLVKFLFDFAITTNPEPNSTWFSLDHLTRHNVLEHDVSLSRVDNFFGHADAFNQEAFDETASYWGDVVSTETAVDALIARRDRSKKTNPHFSLSELGEAFLIGETAAFINILGDAEAGTANTTVVRYLFENERLPTELGWKRREVAFTEQDLSDGMDIIGEEYRKRLNSTTPSKRGEGYKRVTPHGTF
ncbi:related to chloroperoxidase [Cephalotrichum gorgonifer]|uniref:Related to chloroperoxidase n=1 Tax=Cephalotrichum gorgonifer TaxID=2041049 RepID=A0AAE8N753_9PEZI|nr:related to chloroperoxidase [Cephalotrichum gorgonifer]